MTAQETGFLLKFFIQDGYVLNFSNNSFATFTMQSVGVDIQGKYGGSKGSSLTRFVQESSSDLTFKLFSDLLEHYKLQLLDDASNEHKKAYEKCASILDKYKGTINALDVPALKKIDSEYIRSITQRAIENVNKGNLEDALTLARTLLEAVFIHIIEKQNVSVRANGQIQDLYKQVKSLYNMHNDSKMDKRINELLSGLNNIVSAIGEMRNKAGSAHGYGSKRISIKDYHARLCVNSAMALADFVLSVADNNNPKK